MVVEKFHKIILRLKRFAYKITPMNIEPIATINTPFSEKFTIPRQASIVTEAVGKLYFTANYRQADCFNGLKAHSHYWLIWGFHKHIDKNKALTVRPPRLGGNTRVGVFATRSPFRPNNLGLSVVKLESLDIEHFSLTVSGVDMLNGTPIYDIKPYIPYADMRQEALSEWANSPPTPKFSVTFLSEAEQILTAYDQAQGTRLRSLLSALLVYDARPAYQSAQTSEDKVYATTLYNVDIKWKINNNRVTVISAEVQKNQTFFW